MAESTNAEMGRWALVGDGPASRFLLERFHVRSDFPLVCVCAVPSADVVSVRAYSLPVLSDFHRVMEDPDISGVILTGLRQCRGDVLQAALRAEKLVLVEGDMCLADANIAESIAMPGDRLGVFQLARPDQDFLAAQAAIRSGRLGGIHTVRYISCAQTLPDSQSIGASIANGRTSLPAESHRLFTALQQIISGSPVGATAWSCNRTSGFMARLDYSRGVSAWIDMQRASLCDFETGWLLEGDLGAYRNRRLMTRADDGEIVSEELLLNLEQDLDVFTDLKGLALSGNERRASFLRAVQSTWIGTAVEAAMQSGVPVRVPRREEDFDVERPAAKS